MNPRNPSSKKEARILINYYCFTLVSVGATLLLIFIGGLVRVSGSGMGCPDWPTCYGLWIPPTSLEELPKEYDPSSFNPILTWIEYINRLCGALYGVIIIVLFVLTFLYYRRNKLLINLALLAVLFTGFQGWLGKLVVDTDLYPFLVTLHLLFALFILLLLVLLSQKVYFLVNPKAEKSACYPRNANRFLILIFILAVIQIILGTQVREKLEVLADTFPLAEESLWMNMIGSIGYIHATFGCILLIITWISSFRILSDKPSKRVNQYAYSAIFLTWTQLLLGTSLFTVGIPEIIQLLHQWISSIFITICLLMLISVKQANQQYRSHL